MRGSRSCRMPSRPCANRSRHAYKPTVCPRHLAQHPRVCAGAAWPYSGGPGAYLGEPARADCTGALHVVLPPHVAKQLGLLLMGTTGITMADGRLVEGEMSEPVTIELLQRQISINTI